MSPGEVFAKESMARLEATGKGTSENWRVKTRASEFP